ncbi:MAG: DNA polymerase III subunit gamma/tau [Oscillospiraceae bacterium]|jgi:DNA polymerase-3 subunit gamma/tau|nr:DNA polymerase III subunit gamma/tau [Oscillospiraceae bacterium]
MPDSPTLALYRLWRSKRFSDLIGQDAITAALRAQARDKSFTHAYLFSGPRGTGKTSTAKIFARAINCLQPEDGEPCGHCAVCDALSRDDAMDVLEIDAASNTQVEQMRELLSKVMYPPAIASRRVYIIDEVHMLSRHAFNALLKTLEEPPSHIVFILATTEPNKLPETILSRCQWYAFHRIEPRLIVERLELVARTHRIPVAEGALWLIARAAEGGMRDALSLLDVCRATNADAITEERVRAVLGAADPETLFALADSCAAKDAASALRMVNDAFLSGLDPQELASNMSEHIRALLMAMTIMDGLPRMLAVTAETAERYRSQASRFRMDNLMRLLDLFAQAAQTNKWNADPRLTLEIAVMRACVPEDALRLEEMAARVDALERKLAELIAKGTVNGIVGDIERQATPTTAAQSAASNSGNAVDMRRSTVSLSPKSAEPAASAPPPPIADDPKKLWAKVIEMLTRSKPPLMAQLRQGVFAGIDGGSVRVVFTPDKAIHADYVKKPENVKIIEDSIERAFGARLRLVIESGSNAPAPQPKPDVQQQAFDLFSREKVEVVEEETPF